MATARKAFDMLSFQLTLKTENKQPPLDLNEPASLYSTLASQPPSPSDASPRYRPAATTSHIMKYLAVLAAVAITTNAVALPEAEAEAGAGVRTGRWNTRWCRTVGQPCWKVKRAADAFSAAITAADIVVDKRSPEALASHSEGGEAYMAKRYLSDLAGAVASSQPDPLSYYGGLGLGQRFADDTAEGVEKREAEAEAGVRTGRWNTRWCRTVGQPCWKAKKRSADEDEQVTEADSMADDRRWCSQPGAPCSVAKRAAEALLEAVEGPVDGLVAKREAEAAPWNTRWCRTVGQPCWKEKTKREAFCTNPDEPCWEQETDPEAWKAQRDLDAMVVAARAVIENVA
ncbi:Clock-controlled pheromone ccg-4 [Colletotrichum tanaceti]|uniref:Clock-controlled pheromone ccg-4 n=1 Tax=Colletotrichum tanaceti TaxID=1306861 RepID=A0A4U6X6E6_9PEZI|nr:Clock-controlled pheromone ccg-4 [Colletotrichum tanaceti]